MLISHSHAAASLAASLIGKLTGAANVKASAPAEGAAGLSQAPAAPAQSPKDEFLAYAKLTPAQKMRYAILAKMGLKEEDLAGLDEATRKKVEQQVKDEIKRELDKGTGQGRKGMLVDVSA